MVLRIGIRMVIATVVLIVTCASFIVAYAVVSLPLEYNTDILGDAYDDIASEQGWDDAEETKNNINMGPWFLAGAVVTGIFLMFVWFIAYAHKDEYEKY